MNDTNIIPASQARENVEKAGGPISYLLEQITDRIKCQSIHGFNSAGYIATGLSDEQKTELKNKLSTLGYKVDIDTYFVSVSW